MIISGFEWDDGNAGHIARHGVLTDEAEEAVVCTGAIFRRSRGGRYTVLGHTDSGRYLTVVFELIPGNLARVITAFDMSNKDRRSYHRQRGD